MVGRASWVELRLDEWGFEAREGSVGFILRMKPMVERNDMI